MKKATRCSVNEAIYLFVKIPFLVLMLLMFTVILNAQSNEFSKWSFTAEGGLNKFDGDINQSIAEIIPTSFLSLSYGATVERALTPIFGLSLDYFYFPLKASTTTTTPVSMYTQLYTSNICGTINLTRWIFPKSRSNFYINASFGLGFAYYTYDVSPASQAFPNNKYGLAGSFPATLSLEYNFSKPLAIGFKAMYRFFNKDDLEGVTRLNYKGVTNDGITALTLYLRYKFKAVQKHHLRNMTMDYFDPDEGLAYAKVLRKDFEGLKLKVDSLEKKVNSLESDLVLIRKMPGSMNINQKGIAIQPMNETNSPESLNSSSNNGVKSTIFTQPSRNQITKIEFDSVEFASIYFDSNQFLLDKSALSILSQLANKLIESPQLKIRINGYCDDTGDITYNNKLSRLRADNVKEKLVKTWDIAPDRIIAVGMGKALSRKANTPYRPNRRCDFFLSK